MPRDSAGVFTLPSTTWATTGQTISVNQHNPAMREIETAITDSLPRNGSAGMTGHLNMADNRITNLADPVGLGDAVSLGFMANASAPVGVIMDFAGDFAPDGWFLCDGRSLSRTTYSALFAVIGTKFGSNSATTFKVPDLRGRVIAGLDNMGGSNAGRITSAGGGFAANSIGATGGVQAVAITMSQMPSHNHGSGGAHTHTGSTNTVGDHSHSMSGVFRTTSSGGGGWSNLTNTVAGSSMTGSAGAHSHTVTINSGGAHTHNTEGGNQPHSNMQPTMVMNKIIRAR